MDKEVFDRTINHLSSSLDNVQNTIRYIDAKVGIAVSVLSVVFGGILSCSSMPEILVQLAKSTTSKQWICFVTFFAAIAFVVLMVFGFRAAWQTINARAPTHPGLLEHWLLFPLSNEKNYAQLYDEFDGKLCNGLSCESVIEEYKDQLTILSRIQNDKIRYCNSMLSFFGWALFSLLICGVLLFVKAL